MSDRLTAIIRRAAQPLAPIPTAAAPRCRSLPGLRVVLFDVYGTLLISGSGDVGSADPTSRNEAFAAALEAVGMAPDVADAALLRELIERAHARLRETGVDYPEVDIVEVWRDVVTEAYGPERAGEVDLEQLAVEFEVRANPVWPMPGLADCLGDLRRRGLVLGIVSNAQFFTPLAMEATTGKTLDEHGFDPALRYYSYEHRQAKPGRWLYERAAEELASRGFRPHETLYVGNDMRNDVWPAAEIGFRTALFAGDRRSLRLRLDDSLASKLPEPDVVVTELPQILSIADACPPSDLPGPTTKR